MTEAHKTRFWFIDLRRDRSHRDRVLSQVHVQWQAYKRGEWPVHISEGRISKLFFSALPQRWMEQMARNMSLADVGFLNGCRYLLHDRDAKFCAAFAGILEAVGIKTIKLPPRSPNLNANLER